MRTPYGISDRIIVCVLAVVTNVIVEMKSANKIGMRETLKLALLGAVAVATIGGGSFLAFRTYSSTVRSGVLEIQSAQIEQIEQPILWIDVRNQWERDLDFIPDSHLVPVQDLSSPTGIARVQELIDTFQKETGQMPLVVLYCERGIRSAVAFNRLAEAGIESASLAGGIQAWRHLNPADTSIKLGS